MHPFSLFPRGLVTILFTSLLFSLTDAHCKSWPLSPSLHPSTSQSAINAIMSSAPIPFLFVLTDHLTQPVTNQSYPSFPAYFQITSPSQGTQLQNGAANKVTWVKGLLDDVNAFDVEMSRLSVDGLILVARDGKHCPCLFSLFHSPNITFPASPLIPSRLRLSSL